MLNFVNPSVMIEKTWAIVLFLTMSPESARELVIGLTLAYLAVSITLAKMHGIGGEGSSSILIGFIVTAVGIFGMIEVAVLADMVLLPLLAKQYKAIGYYGSVVLAIFLMLVPLTRTFFRTGYTTSIGAWSVALMVGAGIIMGVDYALEDKERKEPTIENAQQYTKEVKDELKEKGKDLLHKKKETPSPSPSPAVQP